jgi:hypothetical protein
MSDVTLDIDRCRRLDREGFGSLIRAVADAHPDEPESDALEWKRTLDLSGSQHRFELARHILGMGNRAPRAASAVFGGYAYILIGVEPGRLDGVTVPDPAELSQALGAYIRPGRPAWRLELVVVEDVALAVIEVEAPRLGDRICTLSKGHDRMMAGRVFTRRQGQTVEASPDEIRMLEERFAAPALEADRKRLELDEQRFALERARDERERIDRAVRDAPRFAGSPRGNGFSRRSPDRIEGLVRNVGVSAAQVESVRLHKEHGGAVPGSLVPVYGSPPTEVPAPTARIDAGADAQLSFRHGTLAELGSQNLTVEVNFEDDAGLHWRVTLPLRRRGSVHDQPQWVVVPEQIEQRRG